MALIKLTIALSLLLFASCSGKKKNPEQSVPKSTTNQAENFNTFFERFSSDSVFQKSRIKFPLRNELYDIDTKKFDLEIIKTNEWTFFDIKNLDKKHIFNISKEKDQYIVNAQVEDTGISVDYIFEQRDGKWTLVKIVDEST